MRRFGLIGKGLTHSFSSGWFTQKFLAEGLDAEYLNYPMDDLGSFRALLDREIPRGLEGLNVTVPYKKEVLPFLDELDPLARDLGAVNTIHIRNEASGPVLKGFNTDVTGFRHSLENILEAHHDRALVFGTGGASTAVRRVLQDLGIPFTSVSRRVSGDLLAYEDLDEELIGSCRLLVNTTPLGMFPDLDSYPDIPYPGIGEKHLCYDLVYNPGKTVFLERAEARGARISNGYEMLVGQALAAWEIWNT